jgi:NDP-sugar pyrophosphorylase family protein
MLKPDDFFDLSHLDDPFVGLFSDVDQVWELLVKLDPYLKSLFPHQAAILGQVDTGATLVNPEQIYIGPGTHVEAGVYIAGPTYIGANCQVRHGAYIRGSVIAGDNCVLGHASEFKNALLLPGSHAAHFAYVGDSILGHRVNLGAGTKLANLEVLSDLHKAKTGRRPTIKIRVTDMPEPVDTGLTKMGAIFGDDAQAGCNTVTNPGCLIGRGTLVYPNVSLPKGYYAAGKIIKLRQQLEEVALGN